MGRLKDYMIENDLGRQRWVSRVDFSCPACGELINQEVEIPEPNFAAERSRDMTVDGDVEIVCESCGENFDGEVWAGPAQCDITLHGHDDTNVTCEPPGYDRPPEDWLDSWELPEHPKEVFDLNHQELSQIIEVQADYNGGSLMNRMIFAQILTFLEAFFCDTLIKGLRENRHLLVNFAEKDGAINAANIKASSILRDPKIVENLIENSLKGRLYHQFGSGEKNTKTNKEKLEGVPLWYGMAFNFALTPTSNDLASLRLYALHRHDCVHRNGETKDGDKLTFFSKSYLSEALNTAKLIVEHIDTNMQELSSNETADI